MLRSLAVIAGCGIVLATAHVAILSSGGYAMPTTPLQLAVALGLCVGSVCVGSALSDSRWPLAFVFIVALLSGEAYAIITTSEATIKARDTDAAPIVAAEEVRTKAEHRVEDAEAAKTKADAAALTEAAKPGCRRECRTLIEGAKADAQRELEAARAALSLLPPPRSSAPLADRLHIAGWTLDLITAALRSIAANGLGAALIAFGAHTGKRQGVSQRKSNRWSVIAGPAKGSLAAPTARDHAVRFSRDVLTPADADTPVAQLHSAYLEWCRSGDHEPFPTREIGAELAALFRRTGVEIIDVDGTRYIAGARIKLAAQLRHSPLSA